MSENFSPTPPQDDIPIDLASEDRDLPLELSDGRLPEPPQMMKGLNTSSATILEAYNSDSNINEAYAKIQGNPSDTRDLLSELAAVKSQLDVEAIKFNFENDPGVTQQELGDNLEVLDQQVNEEVEAGTDVPRQVVDAASTENTSVETAKRIEQQLRVMDSIQKIVDDYSFLEKTGDVLSAFLPGKILIDNKQLTGNFFGADDFMRNLIVGYKSLSAEEQEKAWPAIEEELLDKLPKMQALSAMTKFMNPFGEEDLPEFSDFWAGIDLVDVGLTGASVAIVLARLRSNLNAVKMLKELDNIESAADANAISLMDGSGKAKDVTDVDQLTAYSNALPFNVTDVDGSYTAGLSAESLARISKVAETQKKVAIDISNSETFVKEQLLEAGERVSAETKFSDALLAEGMENVKIIGDTPESTTFSYSYNNGKETVEKVGRLDLKLSDVTGTFEALPSGVITNLIASPTVLAKGTTKEGVKAALRIDSSSSKIHTQFRGLQAEALAPLIGKSGLKALVPNPFGKSTKQRVAEIDNVLLEGDNSSKLYSTLELRAGVNGTPLDAAQIETYFNLRGLYDSMFFIRNSEERKKLVALGMREISIGGEANVGRSFSDKNTATSHMNLKNPNSIWDIETNSIIRSSDLDIAKSYEDGKVLVSLKTNARMDDGNNYKTFLVNQGDVTELAGQVLHFKSGYVPKVTKDGYWFVKAFKNSSVDGRIVEDGEVATLRQFSNRKEAEDWSKTVPEESGTTIKILEDREIEKQILGSSNNGSGGGLYTGARSFDGVPFGKEGLPAERLGALEALSMNMNSLENFVSRNQWRMGMEQRWVNTANKLGVKVDGFEPRAVPTETEAGRGLRQWGEQIQTWSGMPSKSEQLYDAAASGLIEWATRKGLSPDSKLFRGLLNVRNRDPVAAMRSIAFHSLLGMFNPAQIWVQAQGATIALAIATKFTDPLGGVRAFKNQALLGMASLTESQAVRKTLAKSGGISVDTLNEMTTLWKRTGYEDSILKTADHAASIKGNSITSSAIDRALDLGLFPYRQGELFNRRTSFLVALEEFKNANKGVKIGDKQLKSIVDRSNEFMLNMTKGNRASWQFGPASIPTQFLQVNAKMFETLIGANEAFTRGERAKIFFSQLAFYGASGVPFGNLALKMARLDQTDIEELDPKVAKAMTDGFWGWYALSAFDADVELGSRGSILSGLEVLALDMMFKEAPMMEKLTGAFGVIPSRFFQAYKRIAPLMIAPLSANSLPSKEEFFLASSHLASVASSFNSVQKALIMRNYDELRTSRGDVLVKKDFTAGTELFTAFGFQPSDSRLVRDLETLNRDKKEYRKALVDMFVSTYNDYSRLIISADSEEEEEKIIERFSLAHTLLMQTISNPNDRVLVAQSLRARLTNPTDKKTREIKTFLENFNEGRISDLHSISASMRTKGILRTGVLDDKEQ